MKRREEKKWRWKLEEPEKEIIVPTLKERGELGLTCEEAILICYIKYQNGKCFRESNAQPLCSLCPKSGRVKMGDELAKKIEVLAAKTTKKLALRHSKMPYYRR